MSRRATAQQWIFDGDLDQPPLLSVAAERLESALQGWKPGREPGRDEKVIRIAHELALAATPPKRGARCLDPATVYRLMAEVAREPVEEFHIVLLDVRGRLMATERVARGSLSQCPVHPRDVLRPAIAHGAHGIVFVHNHPSGDPTPSSEDADLTERLKAAAELVGILARDHVIVASGGYYSFVEAGRWRR